MNEMIAYAGKWNNKRNLTIIRNKLNDLSWVYCVVLVDRLQMGATGNFLDSFVKRGASHSNGFHGIQATNFQGSFPSFRMPSTLHAPSWIFLSSAGSPENFKGEQNRKKQSRLIISHSIYDKNNMAHRGEAAWRLRLIERYQ